MMALATQASPVKALFGLEELETSALAVIQHLVTEASQQQKMESLDDENFRLKREQQQQQQLQQQSLLASGKEIGSGLPCVVVDGAKAPAGDSTKSSKLPSKRILPAPPNQLPLAIEIPPPSSSISKSNVDLPSGDATALTTVSAASKEAENNFNSSANNGAASSAAIASGARPKPQHLLTQHPNNARPPSRDRHGSGRGSSNGSREATPRGSGKRGSGGSGGRGVNRPNIRGSETSVGSQTNLTSSKNSSSDPLSPSLPPTHIMQQMMEMGFSQRSVEVAFQALLASSASSCSTSSSTTTCESLVGWLLEHQV